MKEPVALSTPKDLVDRLEQLPGRLSEALKNATEDRVRRSPGLDALSAHDVLAHLRAADDIVAPRVYMLLTRDQAPLAAFDERVWAQAAGYAFRDVQSLIQTYALRRNELVATLRRATTDHWIRMGIHETRGHVTLLDIVRSLVEHEEEHAAQLEIILTASAPPPASHGRTSAAE